MDIFNKINQKGIDDAQWEYIEGPLPRSTNTEADYSRQIKYNRYEKEKTFGIIDDEPETGCRKKKTKHNNSNNER